MRSTFRLLAPLPLMTSTMLLAACGGGDDYDRVAEARALECQAITDDAARSSSAPGCPATRPRPSRRPATAPARRSVTCEEVHGRHRQSARQRGGLRRAEGRRHGGRCGGRGAGRARPRRAGGDRPRRRRASSCTTTRRRRPSQAYDGRETAPADGDRELPALDRRRHRSDHAAAERARERPLDRHPGPSANDRPRPEGTRQAGVEGPVQRGDRARHQRLPDQRPPGRGDRVERDEPARATPKPPRISSMPTARPKALGTVLKIPAYAADADAHGRRTAPMRSTPARSRRTSSTRSATTSAVDGAAITPGKTTLADLATYQAKLRTPVCTTYRAYWVCGMPPPTSGGITVAQSLGILENFNLGAVQADGDRRRGRQAERCSACTSSARPSGSPTPIATCTSPTPTSFRCPAAPGTRCSTSPTCEAAPA